MTGRTLTLTFLATAGLALAPLQPSVAAGKRPLPKSPDKATYKADIQPLLNQYCYGCHGEKKKGDLDLRVYTDEASVEKDRDTWSRVIKNVRGSEMPPKNKPQPTPAERELISDWVEAKVFHIDCNNPDPGRVTIRRLNRVEYNNTVHDLVGVNFKPADDFPADDTGYGFDNIGDVLSMPPILLEKYLAAAEKILSAAIVTENPMGLRTNRHVADSLEVGYNAKRRGDGWVALNSIEEDDVAALYKVRGDGEWVLRVKAYAESTGTNPVRLTFMLDKQPIVELPVEARSDAPKVYEARVKVASGDHRFRATVRRLKNGLSQEQALEWKSGTEQKGTVFVQYLEIEGPLDAKPGPLPETHQRIFTTKPAPGKELEAAKQIIGRFARRAFRRPVTPAEVDRLTKLYTLARSQGDTFEGGVKVALEAVMVSPHFLFRGELQPEPDNPKSIHNVNEFALASRLSYFLWSTMPDEELFALAEKGSLRKNLEPQVQRMLKDPRARALIDNFAGQWLQTRNLRLIAPDAWLFPEFDESLRDAMQKETELFFEHVMREDKSVLEFLTAQYTFVNERLAAHYDLPGVKGEEFRRVSLKGTPRAGILTHASVLTITSNPTRTSPVKRGKWILETILGTPPPPPPPNVPELDSSKQLTGTLRQRMEQHRENPNCAGCHARMDPIGFGFENFNAIGGYRSKDGSAEIDPAGELVSGESFKGAPDLTRLLSESKRDEFVRCLTEKMLTYALGRGLEYYDKCAMDQITKGLAKNKYKFSSLIVETIKSTPFQKRRGEGDHLNLSSR